jgi:HAE1 family hydrophobic/amphiphilic exporter-1
MLSAFGIGLDTVATTVRSALEGSVPGSLTRRGVDTDIRVVLAHSDMRPAIRLGDLVVLSENREPVPLNSVVRIIEKKTSALLVRADRQDAATVLIHHPGEDAARIGNRIQSVCRERSWVSSLSRSVFDEQFSRLCITFGVAVLLLYLVLTAQFESFVTPFILLTTLPLAGCGLLTALAVSGKTINLSSSLGALVLLGIVMNNAIVLFETYRRNRRPPVPPLAAVFKGSIRRFRPILMTMLTTIAALLPVAFDPLQQSNQSGMAAGIIGGLFVSTLLTIIIIPLLYRSATRRERWSEL